MASQRFTTIANLLIGLFVLLLMLILSGCCWYGYTCFDALFIQPAITRTMAQDAIDKVEHGWIMEPPDGPAGRDDFHGYIFHKDNDRRDVNVSRDADGKWSAEVTPIFDYGLSP